MNKINQVITIFLTLLLLNACGSVAEGLGGGKKKGSDEFLVEKKAPLVLPPSFSELPEPGSKSSKDVVSIKKDTPSIEEMIGQTSSAGTNKENDNLTESFEMLIIKKINER